MMRNHDMWCNYASGGGGFASFKMCHCQGASESEAFFSTHIDSYVKLFKEICLGWSLVAVMLTWVMTFVLRKCAVQPLKRKTCEQSDELSTPNLSQKRW